MSRAHLELGEMVSSCRGKIVLCVQNDSFKVSLLVIHHIMSSEFPLYQHVPTPHTSWSDLYVHVCDRIGVPKKKTVRCGERECVMTTTSRQIMVGYVCMLHGVLCPFVQCSGFLTCLFQQLGANKANHNVISTLLLPTKCPQYRK